jgi:hypothetical protein
MWSRRDTVSERVACIAIRRPGGNARAKLASPDRVCESGGA